MRREKISIQAVKDCLRTREVTGVALEKDVTVAQLFATVSSLDKNETIRSAENDWAFISYVHSYSALGSGGMPDWVAEDAEQVLDGLLEAKVLSERAVWFDRVGVKQSTEWPVLATIHCLAAPVIVVPPTRTLEYSRYQIPDRWDATTFDFFTKVENLLQSCPTCGPKCPAEFDARLLNVAAALRAWQTNEAIMGASSRGSFVSFSTLDRLQYTISWYQVLLQIALDLGGYGPDLLAKSIDLYGQGLFEPCSRCLSVARTLVYEEESTVNFQLLDDTLVALVMQANRFATPLASDEEGLELWSLEGLYKSPGEAFRLRKRNSERLLDFSRTFLSQSSYRQIAANICRGRPALSSSFRDGDKWLCALVLSNIDSCLQAFKLSNASFAEQSKEEVMRLLKLDDCFGELCFRDSTLEVEANRCTRAPPCSGDIGHICLFSELSGILHPGSVGQFLYDRGLSTIQCEEVMESRGTSLQRRLQINGIALLCYELKDGAVRTYPAGRCGSCLTSKSHLEFTPVKQILIGWKAKEEDSAVSIAPSSNAQIDLVYSFVTINTSGPSHVQTRGIFSRRDPHACRKCGASHVRVEVENSKDLLEIHVSRVLPIATTVRMVFDALHRCHQI